MQPIIQEEPILFWDNVLGAEHWSKQEEILNAVFSSQKTTVRSCHGIGKSYSAARIGLTFLHAFKDSIVVTTAPTFRQVQTILWREWRGACATSKIPLGVDPLKVVHEISENWYAIGMSANKPDNFQGLHASSGQMLVIVDEADGLDPQILVAIQSLLTSSGVHLLMIGNPTRGAGKFYDSHKDVSFTKLKIDVFMTPNFKYNKIKDMSDLRAFKTAEELKALHLPYPQLVTPLWAWDRMHDWGETSPIFQSRVLADFPTEGSDTLIPLHLVEKALEKEFTDEEWLVRPRRNVVGIDVARYGEDTTVVTSMDNMKVIDVDWHNGKDTMKTVGLGIKVFQESGFDKSMDTFVVDDTGVGGGVTDRLRELGYNVIAVNFGSASSEPEAYVNLKAEIFWELRQCFYHQKIQVTDCGKMVAQIPMIRFAYNSQAKLEIVSKKQMKKDGHQSPDFVDSLALAVWGVHGHSMYSEIDSVADGDTIGGDIYSKVF